MKCNTSQPPDLERTNPFCAARLRPGTIDYVFEEGNGLPRLVDLLEANGWLGQITGGHGTGKSTLLAALTPVIEGRGRLVESVTLAAGQRRLPRRFLAPLRSSAGRERNAVELSETDHAPLYHEMEAEILISDQARRVRAAMDRLAPNYRTVMELAYFEGLSQSAMSVKMGQPLGTIKTWVRTALQSLRNDLGVAVPS